MTSARRTSLLALLAAPALLFAAPSFADTKNLTEDDVVAIVKRVIKEQPEIIIESLESMKSREQANAQKKQTETLKTSKDALFKNPLTPFIGNPKGDVTVVEFFDYHCGYCKRMLPVMQELVKQDKNVKVLFKEFPILSEDSGLAARAALAVNKLSPKRYFDYHTKLMNHKGEFTEDALLKYADEVGVDRESVRKESNAEWVTKYLAEVRGLASKLDIQGTPAMIIDSQIFPGATDLDTLKAAIAKARAAK